MFQLLNVFGAAVGSGCSLFMKYLRNPKLFLINPKLEGDLLTVAIAMAKPGCSLEAEEILYADTGEQLTLALVSELPPMSFNVTFKVLYRPPENYE